jgi:purine-nucleoside phosphorylase
MTVADGRPARAAARLRDAGFGGAVVGVVLGSGLSPFLEGLEARAAVRFSDVPGFPAPTVGGHGGTAVACSLGGRPAVVLAGRVHHYEGRPPEEVTFGVRMLHALGASVLVLTNAAGGVDPGLCVGDVMLIADQISVVGGRRRSAGPTYRTAGLFAPRLRALARRAASERGVTLREGVYLGSLGPAYETPAEIALARRLGAGAVGMSTVSEAATAASLGLEVLGLSLITNVPLPGRSDGTTHDEVLAAGRSGSATLLSLVEGVAERL